MMRDLAVDSQRYLLINRSSAHLSLIGFHLHCFLKLHLHDHAHHNHYLVSDFCLLSPAPPLQHTHVTRLQTITPEGSAKNIWNVLQNSWHGDWIQKSGHRRHPCYSGLGFHATGPPCARGVNDSSDEYCEETDTCHTLADLLEQFQQLKN